MRGAFGAGGAGQLQAATGFNGSFEAGAGLGRPRQIRRGQAIDEVVEREPQGVAGGKSRMEAGAWLVSSR